MASNARLVQVLATAALLAGCACTASRHFPIGSPREDVVGRLGAATAEHLLPTGARRLEYAGGAYGRSTLMFDFGPADRLIGVQQVRSEAHFNAIRPGMGVDEVLARIGRPSTVWSIPRQRQNVWSYRYESPFCQWFMVGMGYDDRVVDSSYGPDPLCEDGFLERFTRGR
jgi:hypothetical protein